MLHTLTPKVLDELHKMQLPPAGESYLISGEIINVIRRDDSSIVSYTVIADGIKELIFCNFDYAHSNEVEIAIIEDAKPHMTATFQCNYFAGNMFVIQFTHALGESDHHKLLKQVEEKYGMKNTETTPVGIALDATNALKNAQRSIDAAAKYGSVGELSDGYHTFNELYRHRALLFAALCNSVFKARAWKSLLHDDPKDKMYDGMFIVGVDTPDGQATYHYDIDPYWAMFKCREVERAPKFDGHTPTEAVERIYRYALKCMAPATRDEPSSREWNP